MKWYSEHMEGVNEAEAAAAVGVHACEPSTGMTGEQETRVRGMVAALRSGEYPQGRLWLATNGGYCCLGVACEVAMAGGLALSKSSDMGISRYEGGDGGGSERTLPWAVSSWFGFGGDAADNPRLLIPRELAIKYAEARDNNFNRLELSWSEDKRYTATTLNDFLQFTLPDIGECFEFTYLPQDWEARRGQNER